MAWIQKEGSEVTVSDGGGGEGERGASSHLQPLGDALHLQHLSPKHRLGAGGPRRDEERRPSLIGWLLCSHSHTHTIQKLTLTSDHCIRQQAQRQNCSALAPGHFITDLNPHVLWSDVNFMLWFIAPASAVAN